MVLYILFLLSKFPSKSRSTPRQSPDFITCVLKIRKLHQYQFVLIVLAVKGGFEDYIITNNIPLPWMCVHVTCPHVKTDVKSTPIYLNVCPCDVFIVRAKHRHLGNCMCLNNETPPTIIVYSVGPQIALHMYLPKSETHLPKYGQVTSVNVCICSQ